MENLKLFEDVSHWEEQFWYNSGGTRNKKILSSPTGGLYYFKESYNNERGKFYPFEFYSEVIASFLGEMLGLDILKYTVCIFGNKIGCISPNMLLADEELIEGKSYLRAIDNTFMADDKNPKSSYNYQLIQNTFEVLSLERYLPAFFDMLIFDAIIGNSDRHQENWGFIAKHTKLSKTMDSLLNDAHSEENRKFDSAIKWISKLFKSPEPSQEQLNNLKLIMSRKRRFAPIYDSGCCFGRELSTEVVSEYNTNIESIEKYIVKGKAEIYWEGKKISHFHLLNNIFSLNSSLRLKTKKVVDNLDVDKLKRFVNSIDENIPEGFEDYKIPNERKELIVKIITLRIKRIKEIVSE